MIVGLLLAAGAGARFGGDKLLAELGDGLCVAEVACANLRPAVDLLLAVVRTGADELAARLATAGAVVTVCAASPPGIGASIAHGVARTPDAAGWLIALGDMPLLAAADALRVAGALHTGAAIAVPARQGRRGHPVGFARRHFAALAALSGDIGARAILAAHPQDIVEVAVGEASAWHDIDTVADLETARRLRDGIARRGPRRSNSDA